jgi:PAS domain S-box-containing protein
MAVAPVDRRPNPTHADEEMAASRLSDSLPDPAIVIDSLGRVRWGNAAAESTFGRSVQDSIGLSGLDLVHPDDLELVLRSLESVKNKAVGVPIEVRLHVGDGWRLMELVGAPVEWLDEDAVLLTLRDLTQRRRFEVEHDHDSRFRTLVQNSPAVTMLVSPNGTLMSVSCPDPVPGTRSRNGLGSTVGRYRSGRRPPDAGRRIGAGADRGPGCRSGEGHGEPLPASQC